MSDAEKASLVAVKGVPANLEVINLKLDLILAAIVDNKPA
jgi:hypothetical protein